MNLVEALTRTVSFSPDLALEIGIKEAVYLHSIITRFKFEEFHPEAADSNLRKIGLNESQLKSLEKQQYLIKCESGKYVVNKKHFMIQTGSNKNPKKEYRVYDSDEFENLLDKWNEIIKRKIGKYYSTTDLQIKFLDVTFDVGMSALKHSIENGNLNLNFEYARKRLADSKGNEKYSGGNKDRASIGSGARYGRPETNALASELSKRATSLE